MSIINLEKTFENGKLVYFNLNDKIIECICFTKLFKYIKRDYDNEDLGTFVCNKVKIITIYDIYKNIIYEPIELDLFKNPIKIGMVLENPKRNIYFFKTFVGAFIKNNKLNDIKYYMNYIGTLYKCLYDNILLRTYNNIRTFNFFNNKRKCIYKYEYEENYNDYYYYNDIIRYNNYYDVIKYTIYDNCIEITKGKYPFHHTICCNIKNLKIFIADRYYENIEEIVEKRNDNNEIIYYDEFDKIKEKFISDNTNPPFSKPLRNDCIELIDYYKKNINNHNELIKSCLKKEKIVHNNLLLNCNLEMINSK